MNTNKVKFIRNMGLTVAIAAAVAGCAPHLSRQQCMTINWYQMGYSDGAAGHNQRDLHQDILDCAKFKLNVNQGAYIKGWNAGVHQYCKPGNGYRLGTEGQTPNNICPANMAPRFNAAWHRGLHSYCVPSTGYNLGRSGVTMPAFCSPATNVAFRNAYESGYRIYQQTSTLKIEIDGVRDQIAQTQSNIRAKRRDIRKWQNVLSQAPKKHDHTTKRLARRNIRQDKRAIRGMEFQLNRLAQHLNALEIALSQTQ